MWYWFQRLVQCKFSAISNEPSAERIYLSIPARAEHINANRNMATDGMNILLCQGMSMRLWLVCETVCVDDWKEWALMKPADYCMRSIRLSNETLWLFSCLQARMIRLCHNNQRHQCISVPILPETGTKGWTPQVRAWGSQVSYQSHPRMSWGIFIVALSCTWTTQSPGSKQKIY